MRLPEQHLELVSGFKEARKIFISICCLKRHPVNLENISVSTERIGTDVILEVSSKQIFFR
jgi:hypothetical protein